MMSRGEGERVQAIVFSIPVFILAIGAEIALAAAGGRRSYRLNDAVNSLSLGILSQISGLFAFALKIGVYVVVFKRLSLFSMPADSGVVWLFALVAYDFCYYWNHRLGHTCAIFWAAHVVHHQSEDYNLTTALRQPSTGVLLGWIFYLPLAVIGVPPLVFAVVALIDLLYQFWIHTELVGKLGWFDRVFASPSNHRVHHAVNKRYRDKNYGGILILWDRLFGTFVEEQEAPIYGVRPSLASWDPVWANLEIYWELGRRSMRTRDWRDKVKVWFAAPSWKPADLADEPTTPFLGRRYDPPASLAAQGFAIVTLAACVGSTAWFLWVGEAMAFGVALVVFGAIVAALWAAGAVLQSRISLWEGLFILVAAFACSSYALGAQIDFWLSKPIATGLAAFAVVARDAPAVPRRLALAGLVASLVGDILLANPSLFLFGLAAFLATHLIYIALLTRDAPWLPSRPAVAGAAAFALVLLSILWPGLEGGIKLPVVVYAIAISTMLAQAIGRAAVLRTGASLAVACGAALFAVSDSLIATTMFAGLDRAWQLAVLPTYWTAQALISFYVLPRAPQP